MLLKNVFTKRGLSETYFGWQRGLFVIITIGLSNSGSAPDFVEVGEAGIAVDHAMRR
jgi:hypothetical protein